MDLRCPSIDHRLSSEAIEGISKERRVYTETTTVHRRPWGMRVRIGKFPKDTRETSGITAGNFRRTNAFTLGVAAAWVVLPAPDFEFPDAVLYSDFSVYP